MGKDWWDTERQKAYRSTNYHCKACGVEKQEADFHRWLEAHEFYKFNYPKGEMVFICLIPLCHACHNYIHSGRMKALVDKGEMQEEKMDFILKRGNEIIKDAKIRRPRGPVVCAPWEEWRLVFNGKKYSPVVKSYEAWLDHFHPGRRAASYEMDALHDDWGDRD